MNSLGAPSLDGFPTWFYQKHWNSIGREVSDFVLNVLNQIASISTVNDTYITLIPKVKDAQNDGDFRPISVCNVSYKIVAKILAIGLKGFYLLSFLQLRVYLFLGGI